MSDHGFPQSPFQFLTQSGLKIYLGPQETLWRHGMPFLINMLGFY